MLFDPSVSLQSEVQQLEGALVHARQEEKEATSARRALEKELEHAQVSLSLAFLIHVGRHGHQACPFRDAFHLRSHPELPTVHLD